MVRRDLSEALLKKMVGMYAKNGEGLREEGCNSISQLSRRGVAKIFLCVCKSKGS